MKHGAPQSVLNNPFWQFSLDKYARDGVAPICLELQEKHQIDVNILLFAVWLGHTGRAVPDAAAAELIHSRVATWRTNIVRPLRRFRIDYRPSLSLVPVKQDPVRAAIKDLELHAEQIEQALLFELSQTMGLQNVEPGSDTMHRNVLVLLPELIGSMGALGDLISGRSV